MQQRDERHEGILFLFFKCMLKKVLCVECVCCFFSTLCVHMCFISGDKWGFTAMLKN